MGLDHVELVMEVEETFGITIADDDYGDLRTVGDLHALVVERCGETRSGRPGENPRLCLTAGTFCDVRRVIVDETDALREDVRPSTSLDVSVEPAIRRRFWNRLRERFPVMPELRRPAWLRCTLTGATSLVAVAFWWTLPPPALAVALCSLGFAVLLVIATRGFAVHPPPGVETVGELSRLVLRCNYRQQHEHHRGVEPGDAWTTLRVLIVDQLGVDPADVVPDARFIEDLGFG